MRALQFDEPAHGAHDLDVRTREEAFVIVHGRKAQCLPQPPGLRGLEPGLPRDLERGERSRPEQRFGE